MDALDQDQRPGVGRGMGNGRQQAGRKKPYPFSTLADREGQMLFLLVELNLKCYHILLNTSTSRILWQL